MRTGTSPTSVGTVIQRSATASFSIGAAWTSSSTLRASAGVSSYRNGGLAVASTNACDAGSSTTVVDVDVAAMERSFLGGISGDRMAARFVTRPGRRVLKPRDLLLKRRHRVVVPDKSRAHVSDGERRQLGERRHLLRRQASAASGRASSNAVAPGGPTSMLVTCCGKSSPCAAEAAGPRAASRAGGTTTPL